MLDTPIIDHIRKIIRLIGLLNDVADNIVAIANHVKPNAATGIPRN
jgi:endonuclease III